MHTTGLIPLLLLTETCPFYSFPLSQSEKNNSPSPSCYITHHKPCLCCNQSTPGLQPPLTNSLASTKTRESSYHFSPVNSQTLFCSGSLWIQSPFRNQILVALPQTFQDSHLSVWRPTEGGPEQQQDWLESPQFEPKRGAYYWVQIRTRIFLIYLKVIA